MEGSPINYQRFPSPRTSMWPLLQRDGLAFQYVLLVFFWNWAIGNRPFSELKGARKSFVGWTSAVSSFPFSLGIDRAELSFCSHYHFLFHIAGPSSYSLPSSARDGSTFPPTLPSFQILVSFPRSISRLERSVNHSLSNSYMAMVFEATAGSWICSRIGRDRDVGVGREKWEEENKGDGKEEVVML